MAAPATATLIVLRGPGPRTDGLDKPGAIDVTAGGGTITVDKPGFAVFIPGPGQAPIGPFPVSSAAFARLAELLRPPPTGKGADDGPIDVQSAAVASGEILQTAEFSAHVVYDPVFTELPVVRSDQLGVPCDPGPGTPGEGGTRFCPF